MGKFKVGQLVMLVSDEGFHPDWTTKPVPGAFGEVADTTGTKCPVGASGVIFPHYPSRGKDKGWFIPDTHLIPINDPDSITDIETEKSFVYDKEEIV